MIIFPATLESWRSLKDKSYKVNFESFEMTPEQVVGLNGALGQAGYLAFKTDAFKQSEKQMIDSLEADYDDTGKTPGQRLRNVLYVLWNQEPEGYQDFQLYYNFKIEKIISHFKNKLD